MRRLPPRLDMFVRHVGTIVITYLAIGGALAIYDGHAKMPHWWMIAALLAGSILGALMREVPPQYRDDRGLNRA
ncbi:MAG TPA: hypothetical protein VNJ10_00345 [Sphingomonas sp.]|nr:hypothetical protein [Sphingomonas sp.]